MRRGLRGLLIGLCLCGLVACGETVTLPEVDLAVQVEVDVLEVAPGEGFALRVVRTFERELDVAPFDADQLRPLALVAAGSRREEDGKRVRETRHFRAYAFTRDDVVVPSYVFEAGAGAAKRSVRSAPLRIRLAPEVDDREPGPPEYPEALGPAAAEGLPWAWIVAGLVALVLLLLVWRRRRATGEAPHDEIAESVDQLPPEEEARRALAAIRVGDDDASAFEAAVRIEAVLRSWLAAERIPQAAHRSVEELAERLGAMGERLLRAADPAQQGKFADNAPLIPAVQTALEEACALIDAAGEGAA